MKCKVSKKNWQNLLSKAALCGFDKTAPAQLVAKDGNLMLHISKDIEGVFSVPANVEKPGSFNLAYRILGKLKAKSDCQLSLNKGDLEFKSGRLVINIPKMDVAPVLVEAIKPKFIFEARDIFNMIDYLDLGTKILVSSSSALSSLAIRAKTIKDKLQLVTADDFSGAVYTRKVESSLTKEVILPKSIVEIAASLAKANQAKQVGLVISSKKVALRVENDCFITPTLELAALPDVVGRIKEISKGKPKLVFKVKAPELREALQTLSSVEDIKAIDLNISKKGIVIKAAGELNVQVSLDADVSKQGNLSVVLGILMGISKAWSSVLDFACYDKVIIVKAKDDTCLVKYIIPVAR